MFRTRYHKSAKPITKVKEVTVDGIIWDSEKLKYLIETNDSAVIRAMLRIYEYQTEHERDAQTTDEYNYVGFNGCDAEILTSFSKQYQARKFLSPKQLAIARKKMLKYTGQLLKIMAGNQK